MVRIKICGVKRIEDATAAARLGTHAIGINFVPESSRFIGGLEQARELVARSSAPAELLWAGVFANPSEADVEKAVGIGLRIVQLHGEETPEFVKMLREKLPPSVLLWKAFRIAQASDLEQLPTFTACDGWVLDAKSAGVRGGTGKTFDWDLLKSIRRLKPIVLAGGLHPDNVQDAVRRVGPEWVDVASGIESAAGVKDCGQMERFIRGAKA